jgi:hypothetical protein
MKLRFHGGKFSRPGTAPSKPAHVRGLNRSLN